MEIEVKRHADGCRYVRPYLGTNKVTGQPIRPYHRFPDAKTDEEAEEMARAWLAEVAPAAEEGCTHRTGDLLARYVRWVEDNGRSANTVRTYRHLLRHAEALAAVPAREVRTTDLERLYHRLHAPADEGGAGLSNNTVIKFHWFLSGAFRWMVRIGAADVNPASAAEPPEPGTHEAVPFDAEAFVALTEALDVERRAEAATRGERLRREAAFGAYLALNTGMRVGEVCALRRCDVRVPLSDIQVGGTVVEACGRVYRQPTTKGRKHRNVSVTADVMAAIREHEALVAPGRRRGPKAAVVTLGHDWVRPSELSGAFRRICDEYGLPRACTFHSLRHTHATWLLMQGVDAKTVSERLGHASVATTLRIYAHVLPGRDAQAAEAFSRAAREAKDW